MKYWSSFFVLLVFLVSCAQQDVCDTDTESLMVARLKTTLGETVADTVAGAITVYGIRNGEPYTLLYDSTSVARMVLPLDPSEAHSEFVVVSDTIPDTLRVYHRMVPYLISYNCGFAARFNLDSVRFTGGWIRDAEILRPAVDAETEQDETHLWIYL